MGQKERLAAIEINRKRNSEYGKILKPRYKLGRINEVKCFKADFGEKIFYSEPYVPLDQRYLVDIFEAIDNDNLLISLDCEITNILFSKLTSVANNNRDLNSKFKKDLKDYIDSNNFDKETAESTIKILGNFASYSVLYKVFNKLGYSNKEINIFLDKNIKYITRFDYSNFASKDLEKVINYLKEENDMEVIANKLYHYVNLMSLLDFLKIDDNSKEIIVKEKISGLIEENFGEIVNYKNAKQNIKFLNNSAILMGRNGFTFTNNMIINLNTVINCDYNKLISYMSVYNLVELDSTVICEDLSKLDVFDNTIPTELYAVIRKMMENKKNTGFYSLDAIDIVIDNYDINKLKKQYPIKINDTLIISEITKNYKEKYKKAIEEYNKNIKEKRKNRVK